MKCPNCNFEFSEGGRCPNCGVDVFVFQKAHSASIRLYNEAITLAAERNLSGAAEKLEQSLLFDKNNIPSRNLLGLIHCEMGHIGDALKHWIISTSILPEGNAATGYMDYLQKNAREMEKRNDAIRMYNQAITYLKRDSDDLAIIQLKKCIDNNPDFIDAYNLMTLCCIEDKNIKRAQHFNEIVLKRDIHNPLALHYAELLNGIRSAAKNAEKNGTAASGGVKKTDSNPPLPGYKRRERHGNAPEKHNAIAFLIGVAVATVVILVLIVPALNETKNEEIKKLQASVESYAGETSMTPEEVVQMRTELTKLQEENKQLRSEESKQANLELLETALAKMTDQDYEGSVTAFESIDTVGFSEEDLSRYQSLKAELYPKAADTYYTKGKSAFLSNDTATAKLDLEAALKYISTESFADDIYYYLGKIAEAEKDTATAKKYYNQILSEYPDSNQISNAKNALAALQEAE